MPILRTSVRTLVVALLVAGLAACGSPGPTPPPSPPASSGPGASATGGGSPAPASAGPASPATGPSLTPVPGAATPQPDEPGGGTTITDWGRILDQVPEGFPVYPGARPADGVDEPVSGAWVADASVASVAGWYVDTLRELGWSSVDLGSPLEDGSRVLDLASDLPECRVQATFRPAGESTMILVLYGAGCAGGDA